MADALYTVHLTDEGLADLSAYVAMERFVVAGGMLLCPAVEVHGPFLRADVYQVREGGAAAEMPVVEFWIPLPYVALVVGKASEDELIGFGTRERPA
ncbi:MAG TPA: hypothetical protein VD962_10995 [Rubricoccaceae bacterium]|nr:hypothetical protein [Rubricoccaceae bacterium]